MEEIRQAALAYFKAGPEELKELAREFFYALDENGDGEISLHEFMQFLRENGCPRMQNPSFFQELDKDGDGCLDFEEALALFYIALSDRPFCDGCGVFLKGLFFTCVECNNGCNDGSFCLCSACFGGRKFSHEHDTIMDNYTALNVLLSQIYEAAKSEEEEAAAMKFQTYNAANVADESEQKKAAKKFQIYDAANVDDESDEEDSLEPAQVLFKALKVGLKVGLHGTVAASNLGLCSIM